ncbi:glycosyltransferase [Thermosipho ferrireducens]|uniref:Glycosyltransferase n=1 Tax=Thermosipho ferrireducens TaxID=2571116 RepID=A0ABX7S9S7_9BACT|nr:glycosyltransferase family 2 protein [Thermosipho ferrireducens]QTA38477.1 glycosyltransferase [Thermosipho ferrireducens]
MNKTLKVSIITVTYNAAEFLVDAIESVRAQTYENIEYIIVDGDSKDGTQDIIQQYYRRGVITKYISEKDDGIYDAMNKGIDLATGDIIAFLNSDDFYVDKYVISDVVSTFINSKLDVAYGNVIYVSRKNIKKIIRYWKSGEFRKNKIATGWQIPHPALFVRKTVLNKVGKFDTKYKIASDYDFMLRIVMRSDVNIQHINRVIVAMRWGGTSTKSFKNMLKGNKEIFDTLKRNNFVKIPFSFFLVMRLFKRVAQMIGGLKS